MACPAKGKVYRPPSAGFTQVEMVRRKDQVETAGVVNRKVRKVLVGSGEAV